MVFLLTVNFGFSTIPCTLALVPLRPSALVFQAQQGSLQPVDGRFHFGKEGAQAIDILHPFGGVVVHGPEVGRAFGPLAVQAFGLLAQQRAKGYQVRQGGGWVVHQLRYLVDDVVVVARCRNAAAQVRTSASMASCAAMGQGVWAWMSAMRCRKVVRGMGCWRSAMRGGSIIGSMET